MEVSEAGFGQRARNTLLNGRGEGSLLPENAFSPFGR